MADITLSLVDLCRQHAALRSELGTALSDVMQRCDFIQGQANQRFEQAFASYLGVPHVIGVGSGTDALTLALVAGGLGPGHQVITAANACPATAEAIVMAGATPVFADVDEFTLCLDPESFAEAITPRCRAVIPVHLHGYPAPMEAICEIARRHNLLVVEDATQAHGCRINDKMAGTLGDAGCFSFFPSRNLGACGDGGAVVTGDATLAEHIDTLRDHGRSKDGKHQVPGWCSRLDTMQAAILEIKLRYLDTWNARRREIAGKYHEGLWATNLTLPSLDPASVFHHYVIRTDHRGALRHHLASKGIETVAHYPRSIPEEPAYAGFRTAPTPRSDATCRQVLSLPLFPEMRPDEEDRVIEAVRGFETR